MNYFFLLLLFVCSAIQAQDCGTKANPKEIEYMRGFAEQLRGFDGTMTRGIRDFPVKLHILRKSDGTGGTTEIALRKAFDYVNQIYAAANIRFVIYDSPNYINSSEYYDFDPDTQSENALCNKHDVKNVINVYFFNSMSGLNGYSRFPPSEDRVMMSNQANRATLPHELGHYFSLYHSHGKSNSGTSDELVNRSNCQQTGDDLCDTPADPNLDNVKGCTSDCQYNGTEKDQNGDLYKPMVDNLMSYNPYRECRTRFTPQQLARINFCALNQRNYLKIPNVVPLPAPNPTLVPSVDLSGELIFEVSGQSMQAVLDANLYKMKDIYYSGTNYQLFIGNQQAAYIYVLGSDLSKKTNILFPLEGQNAYISQKNTKLILPNENTLFQMDNTVGKDYICVLYSRKTLPIEQIRQKIEIEEGNFMQRVYKVLGTEMIYLNSIAYTYNGKMQFNAKSSTQNIVPIVVEMEHR
jgi:Domain of unknown function (DUF4384)/Pregnancy-associated plasma protein-A